MSSSTPSAGSSYAQSKDTIMMQNLRSYSCSIVKLKLGANEAQWRADVLAASSLYGADHLLSGVHLSLTQEQFERDILPLNEMGRDPRDPNMPKLEPSSTIKKEEQDFSALEQKTSHLRSTWSVPEYPDSLDQDSTDHVEEQAIIDQLGQPPAVQMLREVLAVLRKILGDIKSSLEEDTS